MGDDCGSGVHPLAFEPEQDANQEDSEHNQTEPVLNVEQREDERREDDPLPGLDSAAEEDLFANAG